MTAAIRAGLSGRPRRRVVEQVRREEPNCWICGYWIDQSLPARHPWSSTVDEILPRSLALDPVRAALDRTNLRHAHWHCNSSRGNGTRSKRAIIRSRQW